MRIAMLSWETRHSIPVGGIACHVSELAKALAAKGHDVHVFTRIGPDQSDYAFIDGVHYYRCAYKGHKEFVDDVNSMCRAFVHRVLGVEDTTQPFDLVHAHDWLTVNAMIWIKKGRGRRGVLTIHATEYGRSGNMFHDGRSKRIREQERAGTHWADRVITVSQATKNELMWMYERPDWHTDVVYNGVDPTPFERKVNRRAVREAHAIGPKDPVVLFCGRIDYQKGPDLLLEGFVRAKAHWPSAKLVFAGDGGMRHQIEGRGHECGVGDDVRFTGCLDCEALPALFKAADVVAVPSRNEPFGIVVLEAWSAGKPVLATHNGGPGEYVDHEVDGLKIYPDPDSIAWGINHAFEDFKALRRMGGNGQEKVRRGFTWDVVADETLKVYQAAAPEAKRLPMATDLAKTDAAFRKGEHLAAVNDRSKRSWREPAPSQSPAPLPLSANEDTLQRWQRVLTEAGCRAQRHDGRLIVQSDPHVVFDMLAKATAGASEIQTEPSMEATLELVLVPSRHRAKPDGAPSGQHRNDNQPVPMKELPAMKSG
jgi:glycosyltransferase involved in cell wall biosynthesis